MWLVLMIIAIVATGLNLFMYLKDKETKILRFISFVFTLLTTTMFYSNQAKLVISKNWSAIEDIAPTISIMLWVFIVVIIIINGITILPRKDKLKK